ncbi:hypothetical protein ACFFRR_004656 [Megaselia abdita]
MSQNDFLRPSFFEDVLASEEPSVIKIISLKSEPASDAGEAYSSVVKRVFLDAQLENKSIQQKSLVIKIPHGKEVATAEALNEMKLFPREINFYEKIAPEFEDLYKSKGKSVKFSPKYFESEENIVILEDLSSRNFKNADRIKGLNLDHCKCVLKKMAEFHAASAVYFENNGPFEDILTKGVFTENNRPYIEAFNESLYSVLKKCMVKFYENGAYFADKFCRSSKEITSEIIDSGKIDYSDFNVLNHGDCWSNNIMFNYDESEKIKETLFIDFQYCKYGTPAEDLYYFILSSAEHDLKVANFEYFIKFYYDELVKNLKLLDYPKTIPTLIDIHIALYRHGIWAIMTTVGIMGAALLDRNENASMDNYVSDDQNGNDFKMMVYGNERYIKAMNQLLPWMDNRGVLD